MATKQEQIVTLRRSINDLKNAGMSDDVITPLRKQLATLEGADNDEEYMYNTLRCNSPYPVVQPHSSNMEKCVRNTVDALLQDCQNATWPVLLLGKIQCGKTNTFEQIIALSFDRGIDICIVMTKGTKTLATQTQQRFEDDYACFKDKQIIGQKGVVRIFDILENFKKNGLQESITNKAKIVIVCKKEKTNLDHLKDLFTTKSPYLKHKKVLVVDDEADFASCNFRSVRGVKSMAKITKQITEFLQIPDYCRFLQVTATPYALYLQPDGYIVIDNDSNISPKFKPHHTELVPVHDRYIGGQQYFVDSQSPESMYSHLFVAVDPKCIDVMGKADKRYIDHGIGSMNIYGLTRSIICYFMSAAIRSIQEEKTGKECYTSCLIHLDTGKTAHEWQDKLIEKVIDDVKRWFLSKTTIDEKVDLRVEDMIGQAYADFVESNKKGRDEGLINVELPSLADINERIVRIFANNDYRTQIVNSDNDVASCLNEKGQLELTCTANIFIGGSILDRGITIDNMLCFFYGRDPKNFQMDTVLQHARMYGSRSKEDMAVMRFHTTRYIYDILKKINDIDEELRNQLILMKYDDDDSISFKPEFIGYDKHIKPCASQKIRLTNVSLIKAHQRILPVGFQTGPKSAISKTIADIDDTIKKYIGFVADGFFDMDVQTAADIIKKIRSTYIYEDTKVCTYNAGLEWDENEMLAAIEYSLQDENKEKKVHVHYVENRNMSRVRINGNYIDAPDDGRTDTAPSRDEAVDYPVLMLIRQNGKEADGWRDTPFYWPVLMTPKNIKNSMYALNGDIKEKDKEIIDEKDLGIEEGFFNEDNRVLRLTLSGIPFWNILFGFKEDESRVISVNTASKYLEQEEHSMLKYKLRTDVFIDPNNVSNIESYNDGVFPFVPKKFKYMLFRNSRDYSGSLLLVKLKDDFYSVDGMCKTDKDTLVDNYNRIEEYNKDRLCDWTIHYNIDSVVSFKLNKRDNVLYEDLKAEILDSEDLTEKELKELNNKKK
ncbi:MAG: Z1 domain-containing protein [Salinivirgaceae bacterium]|nr:Z1 domain-containing protein [Salinivirgaceae bacterium]